MENEVKVPTDVWIEEQKKKYGKVYRITIDGEVYVYRALTRPEYREIQKQAKPEMTEGGLALSQEQSNILEENVAKLCVLWPEKYSNDLVSAGVPSILAAAVSDISGYKVDSPPEAL